MDRSNMSANQRSRAGRDMSSLLRARTQIAPRLRPATRVHRRSNMLGAHSGRVVARQGVEGFRVYTLIVQRS